MRSRAKNWFEGLRNNLVKMIEDHDGAKFKVKHWKLSVKVGLTMSVIKGNVIEK